MHGDAGALVSIGLLRNISYADMETCIQRQWSTGRLTVHLVITTKEPSVVLLRYSCTHCLLGAIFKKGESHSSCGQKNVSDFLCAANPTVQIQGWCRHVPPTLQPVRLDYFMQHVVLG